MYTGNVTRKVTDLVATGAVGVSPLRWQRTLTTRYRPTVATPMGDGGSWRHSYQWAIYSSTTNGLISFTINYPTGAEIEFTQLSAAPYWAVYDYTQGVTPPPLAGVRDRVGAGSVADSYILYRPDGTQMFFSKAGTKWRADKVRDPHGLDTTFSYDATTGELLQVTEPAGRYLQLTWFKYTKVRPGKSTYSKRLIQKVATNDGQSVTYAYDLFTSPAPENGSYPILTGANYGDGTAATYTYRAAARSDGHGRPLPLSCDDPRYVGPMSRVQYDYNISDDVYGVIGAEKSLVTGATVATYTLTSTDSQGYGGTRTETKGDGRTRTLTFDRFNLSVVPDFAGNASLYTYGAANFKASRTDALNRTISLERESQTGAVTKRILPGGAFTRVVYSNLAQPYFVAERYDELNRKTAYTRDARNNVTRVDYPDGAYETWTFNAFNQPLTHCQRNGGTETFAYDVRGLKTSWTDAENRLATYAYDARDRLASVTDPLNHVTAYLHNVRGLLTKITYADNTFVTITYDAYGNALTRTDELNHTWKRAYDEYNRLVSTTDPLNRTTTYSYGLLGGSGCGSCHADNHPTRVTLPSGKYTTFTYDNEMRRTGMTVAAGTPEAATTAYAYDAVGRLTSVTDPRGKLTTYTYDDRNRRLSATDPLGHKTEWTYDAVGNRLTEKRADNGVTTFEYDVMKRRTKATDPLNQVTQWAYDPAGNLLTLTDARNNLYGFTYDLRNRKTRMTYPGGSHEDWSYDVVGRLAVYTTRAGQTKTCTYDVRNRDTLCDWSDDTPDVTKTYDAASRLLTFNNASAALTYTYDNANQVLSETQNVTGGPGTKTVAYTYDQDGNRASLGYPDNTSTVTYGYTARNQLKQVTVDGPPPLVTYAYDLAGNVTAKALEDGTTATSTYDDAGRLTSLDNQLGTAAPFASFTYALNAVNNRTAVTREDGKGDAYAYDATDQLTGVQYDASTPAGTPTTPSRTQGFTFDAVGNRTNATEDNTATAYTANALNQYTQVGSLAYSYDVNGNSTGQGAATYSYDAQNRFLKLQARIQGLPVPVMTTLYDARNRAVVRTIQGSTIYLVYDGWRLLAEYDAGGALLARYYYGVRVDELLAKTAANGTVFYHQDGLGSTAALTNASGTVVERYRYDAFGTPKFFNGVGNVTSGTAYGNRFLFTGREWLAGALYDYRNRMYSPGLGRFLQRDPIRFKGGINLYHYVLNSALNWLDPFGLHITSCVECHPDMPFLPVYPGFGKRGLPGTTPSTRPGGPGGGSGSGGGLGGGASAPPTTGPVFPPFGPLPGPHDGPTPPPSPTPDPTPSPTPDPTPAPNPDDQYDQELQEAFDDCTEQADNWANMCEVWELGDPSEAYDQYVDDCMYEKGYEPWEYGSSGSSQPGGRRRGLVVSAMRLDFWV